MSTLNIVIEQKSAKVIDIKIEPPVLTCNGVPIRHYDFGRYPLTTHIRDGDIVVCRVTYVMGTISEEYLAIVRDNTIYAALIHAQPQWMDYKDRNAFNGTPWKNKDDHQSQYHRWQVALLAPRARLVD